MKKTRANWQIPTITNQEIPTTSGLMAPELGVDEVQLLKEVLPNLNDPHPYTTKARMVKHFAKIEKPPIHPTSTN